MVAPAVMLADCGLTLMVCGLMVMVAESDNEAMALLVAVTVAVVVALPLAGAVYCPEVEIVPGPDRLQVTEVSEAPVTAAENWAVPVA